MAVSPEFGVMLPHRWLYASKENITSYAKLAESLGFDHVWVTDHIGVPSNHQERGHIFYESLVTLSYVAAVTSRVRLGTCVLVASVRNPLVTAKQISTLDQLSDGRMILGIGTGWIREELGAFGIAYARRVDYLQEFLSVLKLAWSSGGPLSYNGKYFRFKDMILEPKPAKRAVPILMGGNTPASARMAAEQSDGWMPWAVDPARIGEGRSVLGKKPIFLSGPVQLGARDPHYKGALGEEHHFLSGTETEIVKKMEEYVAAGVTSFVLSFRDVRLFKDKSPDLIVTQTKTFCETIMKSFS
jgi:probable F420-dependent oxidoreductase